jgi:hypothetical protein
MRVNTFAWFALVSAVAAFGVQACSSDPVLNNSASSTGSGGNGGEGTTSTATVTATATSAASTTASTTVAASSSSGGPGTMCGTSACDDTSLAGFITLPACCPANAPPDKCGLDLTAVAGFIGVNLGCVELAQPGVADAGCPDQTISAMGQMVTLPGCCRPDMVCGNEVDFTAVAPGTNFGCVNGSTFLDGGAASACGGGSSSSASSSSASGSSSGTGP